MPTREPTAWMMCALHVLVFWYFTEGLQKTADVREIPYSKRTSRWTPPPWRKYAAVATYKIPYKYGKKHERTEFQRYIWSVCSVVLQARTDYHKTCWAIEYQQPYGTNVCSSQTSHFKWNYEHKHAQWACLTYHPACKVEFRPPIGWDEARSRERSDRARFLPSGKKASS